MLTSGGHELVLTLAHSQLGLLGLASGAERPQAEPPGGAGKADLVFL